MPVGERGLPAALRWALGQGRTRKHASSTLVQPATATRERGPTCQIPSFQRKPEIQVFMANVPVQTFWQVISEDVWKRTEGWLGPASHWCGGVTLRNCEIAQGRSQGLKSGPAYLLTLQGRWWWPLAVCGLDPYCEERRVTESEGSLSHWFQFFWAT